MSAKLGEIIYTSLHAAHFASLILAKFEHSLYKMKCSLLLVRQFSFRFSWLAASALGPPGVRCRRPVALQTVGRPQPRRRAAAVSDAGGPERPRRSAGMDGRRIHWRGIIEE